MDLNDGSFLVKENGSHVCSAQRDCISSLQFDKRVKSRSYSSQFTLGNEVIVAIDRREEHKPIENIITVEVDLSCGIISDIYVTKPKYLNIIRLDEMADSNAWIKKMTTYDTFVDKDVLQTIRDDAMEPNKLYLFKQRHKEQTTEHMAGNYLGSKSFPEQRKLRTTAAQFNPSDSYRKTVDKPVIPGNTNNNNLNIFLKSKNVMRNELIIRTGDIQYHIPNDDIERYSSTFSIDLTTHELPQIKNNLPVQKENEISEITIIEPRPQLSEYFEEAVIESILENKESKPMDVEDIPFAEETESYNYDFIDSDRNKISKSLQYFLPVFDPVQTNPSENKDNDLEQISVNSRDTVTTDENDSMDFTADKLDKLESVNPEDFDESVTEDDQQSLTSLDNKEYGLPSNFQETDFDENESILIKTLSDSEHDPSSLQKYSYDYEDFASLNDIICQENQVIHINKNEDSSVIPVEQYEELSEITEQSNFPFSQLDILQLEPSSSPTQIYEFDEFSPRIERLQSTERSYFCQENEIRLKNENPSWKNEFQPFRISNDMVSEEPIHDIYDSMIKENSPCEDRIFVKTKSFSLNRKSEQTDAILLGSSRDFDPFEKGHLPNSDQDSIITNQANASKTDLITSTYLCSDRKEKFLNSDPNSAEQFFKSVSENSKAPLASLSDDDTESSKKDDPLSYSSEGSMIIKDVSSDDAYIFPKQSKSYGYEVLEEADEETENMENDESYSHLSSQITSTEEISKNRKNSSTSDELSVYSSSTTVTVNEIILKDLCTTPINCIPGHFENFLKERQLRISIDKSKLDTPISTEEMTTSKNGFDKANDSHQLQDGTESNYTEDTSSSSSDHPQIINPILRQGESIEDIAKYLENQGQKGLKRSSGFGSQLNVVYDQEKNGKNLLYNKVSNNKNFSTSSDDNMSLRVGFEKHDNSETGKILQLPNPKNADNSLTPKTSKSSDSSKNDGDFTSSTEKEHSQKDQQVPKASHMNLTKQNLPNNFDQNKDSNNETCKDEAKSENREKKFINTNSIEKLKLTPVSKRYKSDSSSSDSSTSISTSTDNIHPTEPLKSIDVSPNVQNVNIIDKQKKLPPLKTEPLSHSTDDDSSRSISTSNDDTHSENEIKRDQLNPVENQEKITSQPLHKKILKNQSSSSSGTYSSSSSSTEELRCENELKQSQPVSLNRENDIINCQPKNIPIESSKKTNSSNSSSSNKSAKRNLSSNKYPKKKTDVIRPPPKFVDREEKIKNPLVLSKQRSLPTSKKRTSGSSDSSNNDRPVEDPRFKEVGPKKGQLKHIDRKEKFTGSQPVGKYKPLPKKGEPVLSTESDSSMSSSTDESHSNKDLIKHQQRTIDREEKIVESDNKNKLNVLSNKSKVFSESPMVSSHNSSSTSLSTSSDELQQNHESKELVPTVIEKENLEPVSKEHEQSPFNDSDTSETLSTSSEEIALKKDSVPTKLNYGKENPNHPHIINKQHSLPVFTKTKSDSSSSNNSSRSFNNPISNNQPKNNLFGEVNTKPVFQKNNYLPSSNRNNNSKNVKDSNLLEKDEAKKGNVPPKYIDRREKFTKQDQSNMKTKLKKAISVPDYFGNLNNLYSPRKSEENNQDYIDNQCASKFSQSSKTISNLPKEFTAAKQHGRTPSYELLSVNLRDNINSVNDQKESLAPNNKRHQVVAKPVSKKSSSSSDYSLLSSDDTDQKKSKQNDEKVDNNVLEIKEPKLNKIIKSPNKQTVLKVDHDEDFIDGNESGKMSKKFIETSDEDTESEIDDDEFSSDSSDSHSYSFEEVFNKNDPEANKTFMARKFNNSDANLTNDEKSLSISSTNSISVTSEDENKSIEIEEKIQCLELKDEKKNLPVHIDHREKFDKLPNADHHISVEKPPTNNKKKSKSIDRREKFAYKDSDKNVYQKPLKEQIKRKSDSTDEDISFSLTSLVKDKVESNPPDSQVVPITVVTETKIEDENNSLSNNSLSYPIDDKRYNKNKYDKHPHITVRSYQTLPVTKITKSIPIREKSRSLEKPLTQIDLTPLSRSMPGSLGSIVESRYHECTETWSRQSPISSESFKKQYAGLNAVNKNDPKVTENHEEEISAKNPAKPLKQPRIDHDHISAVKSTNKFIKKKLNEPLTTRPRPYPSYLSPVNAFPYIPFASEFGSNDSIVNDYSMDYDAEEFSTKFKSLPEFVKSLSTSSLPRKPSNTKKELKQPIPKPKFRPIEPINLDYGEIETKEKLPQEKMQRNTSITSFTTDSSYLEKPILKERLPSNRRASLDSLSSLSDSPSLKPQPKKIPNVPTKTNCTNTKLNNRSISSTSSSSESDSQIVVNLQSVKKQSDSIPNDKNKSPLYKKNEVERKSNSLSHKRIPSISESSEFSSTSEDESSKIYHF